jgi:hypothetical protein
MHIPETCHARYAIQDLCRFKSIKNYSNTAGVQIFQMKLELTPVNEESLNLVFSKKLQKDTVKQTLDAEQKIMNWSPKRSDRSMDIYIYIYIYIYNRNI